MKTEKHKKIFKDFELSKRKNLERLANKLLKDNSRSEELRKKEIDLTDFFNETNNSGE